MLLKGGYLIGNETVGLLIGIPQVVITTKWDKLGYIIVLLAVFLVVYFVVGSPDDQGGNYEEDN
jgi:type III secretory pathway component EscS